MKLTTLQWAIICTIHQEPRYSFTSDEKKAALRMTKRGLLKQVDAFTFKVTKLGEKVYLP